MAEADLRTPTRTTALTLAAGRRNPGADHLARLLRVRCLLLALVALAAIGVHFLLGLQLPLPALTGIVLALIAITAWSALRAVSGDIGTGQLTAQLVVDVTGLAALLYFTGGWTNPLVSLFLVPIAVGVVVLPARRAWSITSLTIIAYTLLTQLYHPVVSVDHAMQHSFTLHVAGMWLTFVLSAALITYFGSSMVATLRQRERALAAEREENLRNEQIIGVATLAAGTAHELSTPLASIAVIADELAEGAAPHQREELRLLLDQVKVCRQTLAQLRDTASGSAPARSVALDQFMEGLGERLSLVRPRTRLQLELPAAGTLPSIQPDPTLQQALLNLLDNAAAAADTLVICRLDCDDDQIHIEILDDGPGFHADAPTPNKLASGMGMGLLLANATMERLGGQVSVRDRSDGRQGGHVSVHLPLTRLQPQAESSTGAQPRKATQS